MMIVSKLHNMLSTRLSIGEVNKMFEQLRDCYHMALLTLPSNDLVYGVVVNSADLSAGLILETVNDMWFDYKTMSWIECDYGNRFFIGRRQFLEDILNDI